MQPEVFYSRQGFDVAGESNDPSIQFKLDYIQVPVILKIYLLDGLNVHAGPQFGFKVNGELDFSPADSDGDFDTDSLKNFDLQATIGAEYKLLEVFFVQARFTYGLSEVVENADAHNSVLSAGIGFMS